MAVNAERTKAGFVGALVGTFVGDALGAPLEHASVERREELKPLREMVEGPLGVGCYTDDTQMMIALCEAMLESDGEPTAELMIERFLANYEVRRDYGWGTHKLMQLWENGADWREAALQVFSGGSFGNGAAMRIAPLGVFYHHDRPRLSEYAALSARTTNAHPLGVQGAVLQAQAVGLALRYRKGGALSPGGFILDLIALAEDGFPLYRDALMRIKTCIEGASCDAVEVARSLGIGFTAQESVPVALLSFLANAGSFEDAVVFAVNLGGDADTIGAMCGAMAGAYFGVEAIPSRWFDALEDGAKGRGYVISLAERLFELWSRKFQT